MSLPRDLLDDSKGEEHAATGQAGFQIPVVRFIKSNETYVKSCSRI